MRNPSAAKGRYLKKIVVSTTMGPGVQIDPQRDLVQAVQEADPEGRWAMAVADWIPSGGLSGRLLAVQPDRLAAVASWSDEYGPISAEDAALQTDGYPDLTGRRYPVPRKPRADSL